MSASKRRAGTRTGGSRRASAARKVDFAALRAAAEAALEHAHAPYSRLHVAAAVLDRSGRVFTGVNVENASFGLTVCAERNALAAAVGAGARELCAVVVVSSAPHAITPCGACRQVLIELAKDAQIRCYGRDGSTIALQARELLPHAFGAANVRRKRR